MLSSRIFAIMRKEFIHILNDRKTLMVVIIMPILQLIIFGYAMNMELQTVPILVRDFDRSLESQRFIQAFAGSRYFEIAETDRTDENITDIFLHGKIRAIVTIPREFGIDCHRRQFTNVQIFIDASDPNAANLIRNYCGAVILKYNQQYGTMLPVPYRTSNAVWYNPDLKSAYFFVPGILAMILVMISALLTSIAIAREKELGTMEQILVSPIRSGEIIFGKVVPYILLAFFDAGLVLALGMLVFHVPFIGSLLLFVMLTMLYIITALSLGILISTLATSQQTAMMFALVITLLPTLMLSGFIFPIHSMPKLLQFIAYLVPAKYYLVIVRGILIKGNTLVQLMQPVLALTIMSSVMLAVALKKFKTQL